MAETGFRTTLFSKDFSKSFKLDVVEAIRICLCNCQQVEFGVVWVNPLPDDKILGWSILKQIADDILKCIKNGKY